MCNLLICEVNYGKLICHCKCFLTRYQYLCHKLFQCSYYFLFTVSHNVKVTRCSCVETALLLWILHSNNMQSSDSLLQHLTFHYYYYYYYYVQIFLLLVKSNKEKSNQIVCDKFDFWWIDSITIYLYLQCIKVYSFWSEV